VHLSDLRYRSPAETVQARLPFNVWEGLDTDQRILCRWCRMLKQEDMVLMTRDLMYVSVYTKSLIWPFDIILIEAEAGSVIQARDKSNLL